MSSLGTNSTLLMQTEDNATALNVSSTLNHSTYALAGVQCILCIGIIVMNTLALIVFVRSRMELTMKLVLGQLAVTDLTVGILTMVVYIPITSTQRFPFPAIWIQIFGFMLLSIFYITMYSACLVTFERYVHICYPLKHAIWVTPKRIVLLVVLIWMFWTVDMGIMVAVDQIKFDDTLLVLRPKFRKLLLYHTIIGPGLSISILMFCYVGILRAIYKSKGRIKDIPSLQNEVDVHASGETTTDTKGKISKDIDLQCIPMATTADLSYKGKEDHDFNTTRSDRHVTETDNVVITDLSGDDKIKNRIFYVTRSPTTSCHFSKSEQTFSMHPTPRRTCGHITNNEPDKVANDLPVHCPTSMLDRQKAAQFPTVTNNPQTAFSMQKSKEMDRSNKKSLLFITLLITVFLVAYVPVFIITALKDIRRENVSWAAGWLCIFTITNNFLNVLVYTVTFQPFRDAVLYIFCKTYWRRKKREEHLQVARRHRGTTDG